ncbi:hypothetical protein [Paenibacillus apiarius]|uniref:Uncharacterized protein n=1 Tax=Paenibacillus apiarius TaxID=46240 RepID=A0ABT4DWT2_9BACL|nr:hypothetical protein [Paenibacillus apiarius]MCY9516856.1 hypothetical protein [Paenibacillus apiarius]MCY9521705.1 hypothetical protein [Paenibacillus apiarius]MCY9554070.1 hypothetical protein [Paenibacillus apiarius]MCY9558871.1 hypothetical protein [Paenibacillus apiarius]MCY9683917.1 hypothetical protein [Paenibacillus apiarius]
MSKPKRARQKAERAGHMNPELIRNCWMRKPRTQIVPNKKAEQRRKLCRKGIDDGAVFIFPAPLPLLCMFNSAHLQDTVYSYKIKLKNGSDRKEERNGQHAYLFSR